jgi:hypothetical protein
MTTTRVKLTFDEPINLVGAQNAANYSIPGLQILAATRDPGDSRVVYIDTSPQTAGNSYTITVNNSGTPASNKITGIDGSQMSSTRNSQSFTAPTTADRGAPEFSTVSATALTTISVTFNEALDLNSSQTNVNYALFTDNTCSTGAGITINAAVRQSNQAQVVLTTSANLGAGPYYLRASGVQDQWGNGTVNLCSSSFSGYTVPAAPTLSAVNLQSTTSILVTYNEDMTMTGNILLPARYTFPSCGTVTLTANSVTPVNARTVLVTMTQGGAIQNTPCTLTVTPVGGITGTSGVALSSTGNTITFNYSSAADSTPPQVASVAPVDTNTIRVTFNEPMSAGSISTSAPFSDFSISPSTTITGVTCNGPPVTYCDLDVSPDQTTQAYNVTATGMTDVAGNALATSTTSYTGDGRPYIVAITPLDSTHILVQWSEPIGNAASVGPADYTINLNPGPGTLNITGASLYPAGTDPSAFVMLTTAAQTGGGGYTLVVNNPTGSTDSTGNETSATIPGGGGFTGSSSSSAPTVTSASSPASTTVLVNFSEPIDNASIDTTDFAFDAACPLNGIVPTTAAQVSSGVIQLTMPAQAADGSCTVTVTGVRDLLENNIVGSNTATFNYLGTTTTGAPGGDTTKPTITGVVAISNTEIQVIFSEPVANGGTYTFSPTITGATVNCAAAPSTVCTVTVPPGVQTSTVYSLTVSGVQDNATPTPNTIDSTTVTFGGIGSGGSTAPTMYFAQLISPQVLEVSFSEAMDLTTSETLGNYSISPVSPAQTISSVVRQSDPSKVRITFGPGAYGASNSFIVSGTASILDTSNTALTNPMTATFSGFAGAPSSAPDLAAASDTGLSNSDNITNPVFPSPGLNFTGTVTPGSTVILYQNGVPVSTAVTDASGNYSVTQTTSPGNGTFTYTVATVSPTGVVSAPSLGINITSITGLPATPATGPSLAATSDTGILNSDGITRLTTGLSVTGTIVADATYGQTVELYEGATLIGTTTVAAGATSYSFADVSLSASATPYDLTVRVRNVAGNQSAASSPISTVRVDTTAPTLSASPLTGNTTLTLTLSENVYNSTGGNLATTDFAIAFAANGGTATGASITGITHTAPSGTVVLTLSYTGTISGTETITVTSVANAVIDIAGNAASVTTGAKTLSAIGVASITGTPTYTSTGTTTGYITVTWSEGVYTNSGPASGSVVAADFTRAFTQNAGGNSTDAVVSCVTNTASTDCTGIPGTAPAAGATTMRIHITNTGTTSGVETIQVSAATNEIFSSTSGVTPNTVNTGTITFPDRLAPNAPAGLDLDAADDTGSSNSDNITSQTANLTITGTAEANSTVRLYQPNSSGTLLQTVTANGSGNWTAEISLAAGSTYTVVATARDAANNTSVDSASLSITIDTSADAAPGAPDLQAASDLGSSSIDNITNDTTPTFDISCVTGSTVQLYSDAVATGSSAVCAGGTITLTAGTLAAGSRSITAIQTDPAGNASPASAALVITLDTTADAATGTPDLQAASDTGSSNSDNITNDTTPTFDISCVTGSTVQLYSDAVATGTSAVCAGGTVTLTAGTLSAGSRSITAIQTDPAGNASPASTALAITLDTTADAATGTPDLQAASDTGSSNSDNITNDTTPTFDISCVTGSTVQLYSDAVATGSSAVCAGGTVTLTTAALTAGARSITAIQTDPAGNASPPSSALSVTIDTGVPTAPAALNLADADDTGTSNSDNITRNTTALTIDGTSEANATIRIYLTSSAGTLLQTVTANGSGVWSGDITLVEGVNSVVATATDAGGNTSTDSTGLSITVDTTPPNNENTVYATSSSRVGGGSVTIVSSGTASNRVWFAPAGTTTFTAGATMTEAASGTATSILAPATAGSYKLYVIDLAGNISSESTAILTVDNTAPTISSIAPATNAFVNTTQVSYTLDEACASGSVVWTRTGGTADVNHTQALTGAELTAGTKTNITLTNNPTLVSGSIYTVTFNCTDAAGNAATAVSSTNVTYDTTLPVVTVTSPTSTSSVSSTAVSYSNSEICQSGSITWTRTGGTADGSSPHVRALAGAELNAGAFSGSITNNPTLVDGAIYSVAFNCTDRAGNVATTVTRTNVTYSPGPLQIVTAETLDTDNDGKIDTYRVTLNKAVNDSTFPGYALNSLGTVTANWLVAGYNNVRLLHGSAVGFATDTANDTVIYIRFDENVLDCTAATQVGCDTDSKPDLTTTATPVLADLTATIIAQVNTGSVTEADSARPTLVAARSLGATSLDAIFSEPVDTVEGQLNTNYVITGGTAPTVTTATRDGTNTNIVHLVTGTQTGGQAYTLTVNTNVKDLANFNLNSSANSVCVQRCCRPRGCEHRDDLSDDADDHV